MAAVRGLLCPDLSPFHYRGQVVGLQTSLAGTLVLHLRRLIQTDQMPFLATVTTSLVAEGTIGLDGRGTDKAEFGKLGLYS